MDSVENLIKVLEQEKQVLTSMNGKPPTLVCVDHTIMRMLRQWSGAKPSQAVDSIAGMKVKSLPQELGIILNFKMS